MNFGRIIHRIVHLFCMAFLLTLSVLFFGACATGYSNIRVNSTMYEIRQDWKTAKRKDTVLFPLSDEVYRQEDINGKLPGIVYIKTRTQTFNTKYNFILVDGRIYYKSGTTEGDVQDWTLLMGTGLPHRTFSWKFHDASKIVEISADADELIALSDEGFFYRIKLEFGFRQIKGKWYDVQGWPHESQLEVNPLVVGNRGWGIGIRNNQVLWYEDIYHNQHHYGTIGINTLYFLCTDGQELRFADTGLPSDFSHNLLGPERGRFVSESISVSASTMFLINAAGEMYTRLADFDTVGSDPMFYKYTYQKEDYGISGSDYRSNFTPWALPSEDWKKQSLISLSGKARLTRRITILQTGRGNEARELRVAGLNSVGDPGFYRKMLNDDAWEFYQVPLVLSEDDFLNQDLVHLGVAPRREAMETTFEGKLWINNVVKSDYSFTIPDFSLHEGSCHLIIKRRDEQFSIVLHPVEMWTYLKRYNPGRDRTPKLFFVTTDVPDDSYDQLSEEFINIIREYILPESLQLFAYVAEATTDYLLIESMTHQNEDSYLFFTRQGQGSLLPSAIKKRAFFNDVLISRYISEELVLCDPYSVDIWRRSEVEEKLTENIRYRKEIVRELNLFKGYARSSNISRLAYLAFDRLSYITFMQNINFPKIKTLTMYGESIMENNQSVYTSMAKSKTWLYKKILELLDLRIEIYGDILKDFDRNKYTAGVPVNYAEDYAGYFRVLGIPSSVVGIVSVSGDRHIPGRAVLASPLFPGFMIETDAGAGVILVEFKNSAREVFNLAKADPRTNPFKVGVMFSLIHTVNETWPEIASLHETEGWVEWDGKNLTVIQRASFFRRNIIFRSGSDSSR